MHQIFTNVLILITDHIKALYEDVWKDGVLLYTGTGRHGDQKIQGQNKTLAESDTNGIEVHYFERFVKGRYVYKGQVKLAGQVQTGQQIDDDGVLRKVIIFPLTFVNGATGAVSEEQGKCIEEIKTKQAKKLTLDKLKKKIKAIQSTQTSVRQTVSNVYQRNPLISLFAKRSANWTCQKCGMKSPFKDDIMNNAFIQSHHIEWLEKGGTDTIDNVIALCPNCHKIVHISPDQKIVNLLKAKAKQFAS